MQRSNLILEDQIDHLLLETDPIGRVNGHNNWIPAGYGDQKMFSTLQHRSYRPVSWNDFENVTNQTGDLQA